MSPNRAGRRDLPGLAGRFRIAATNAVAEEVLSPRAAGLLTQHPGLALQFLTSSENVKFSRWQADFAVRLRKPDKGDFTISKLGEMRALSVRAGRARARAIRWSAPIPTISARSPRCNFSRAAGSRSRSRFVSDNIRVIRTLIQSHRAIGVLPEYLCGDLLGRPPAARHAAAAPSRRLAAGAESSAARRRRARRDRLGARLFPGICQGVARALLLATLATCPNPISSRH